MPQFDYESGWQLHLRTAKGEILTGEEEAMYQVGNAYLNAEEINSSGDEWFALRSLRIQIEHLNQIHSGLVERSVQLDAEIAIVEETFQQLTGQALTVNSYATR